MKRLMMIVISVNKCAVSYEKKFIEKTFSETTPPPQYSHTGSVPSVFNQPPCVNNIVSTSTKSCVVVSAQWKRLSKEEQDRYYKEAEKERRLHALRHPDWSPKYNYVRARRNQTR